MKLISWNVNGLRAAVNKGFLQQIDDELNSPDILCLQETKAQSDQVHEALAALQGYYIYSNHAEKKGYSGVALLSKQEALEVRYGLGIEVHDQEGRVISARFPKHWVVVVYTPNSQNELARLDYRQAWDAAFLNHLQALEAELPVIVCGDFNVAHQAIDLARPKANYNKSAGYTQTEIDGLSALLSHGFIDSFRHLHPEEIKYSWWSYRANARMKNIGWRIDYVLLSASLRDALKEAFILNEVSGSDHCPVGIEFEV